MDENGITTITADFSYISIVVKPVNRGKNKRNKNDIRAKNI